MISDLYMDINKDKYDFIVIGGGIIGCSIARELSKYNVRTALVESESDLCEGISKANSGVLHAGFNVRPNSLKAKFNRRGLEMYPSLLDELGVDYSVTGKIVVAKDDSEVPYLLNLLNQGQMNGCNELEIIDQEEIKKLVPGVNGIKALLSPKTGVVSPFQLTIALGENAFDNGVEIYLNSKVQKIAKSNEDLFVVEDQGNNKWVSKIVINCAGFGAESIAKSAGSDVPKVYPCRGEYYICDKKGGAVLPMPVYPVPPSDGSGLGVHLTPTTNGNILIGPSADYIEDSSGVGNTKKVMNVLKSEAFDLLTELKEIPFIKNYAGVRPKLFSPDSKTNFEDFFIKEDPKNPGLVNLLGIESPGLTSAPAITEYILHTLLEDRWSKELKVDFNPKWSGVKRLSKLSLEEREKAVGENSSYGEIICRCEGISRGEIEDALNNPLGIKTLNGIKKRTYSMMGRCQSSFCLSKIIDSFVSNNVKVENITKSGKGSEIVEGYR